MSNHSYYMKVDPCCSWDMMDSILVCAWWWEYVQTCCEGRVESTESTT